MAGLAVTRGFGPDIGPAIAIFVKRLHHHGVDAVAAAYRAERAEDWGAGESQIADRIQGLVADKLVGVAQALGI